MNMINPKNLGGESGRQFKSGSAGTASAPAPSFVSTKSLSFGGTNQWVNRTSAAAQVFTTTGSWSFWVKGAGIGNFAPVWQSGENSATVTRGPTFTDSGDTLHKIAIQFFNSANQERWNSSVSIFDGTWHHVVITYSSGTLKIYKDQTEDTSKVHTVVGGVTTLNNTVFGMHLGAQVTTATPATFYNGKMNNLSMWNVVLSQTDINNLASGGKPADLSTHAQFANCKGWYRLGDGDSIAANGLLDSSGNNLHLTPNNMVAGDIVSDAP